jgi:hypothetical protein
MAGMTVEAVALRLIATCPNERADPSGRSSTATMWPKW